MKIIPKGELLSYGFCEFGTEDKNDRYVASNDLLVEELDSENGMSFGAAVALMKKGKKVARKGWNGKGMWLLLGHDITFTASVESTDDEKSFDILKSIVMRTAQDNFVVGWLASQTDMLAEDWEIVK